MGVFGIATAVQASIPDAKGVIHGCYMKSGGALSVVDPSVTTCKPGQTSLNWNQRGVTGRRTQVPRVTLATPGPRARQGRQVLLDREVLLGRRVRLARRA
jgi:hypothetical protein